MPDIISYSIILKGNLIVDNTKIVFNRYFEYKRKLGLKKDNNEIDPDNEFTPDGLLQVVVDEMRRAVEDQGYNLALADACNNLDIDTTYFTDKKRNYIKQIDYVVVPAGAASYFKNAKQYHFWERRLLKWKKIFVKRDSLIQFLMGNMYVINMGGNGEEEVLIDRDMANYILDNKVLYRRCNIKDLVLKRKRNEFVRKTIVDIKMYQKSMAGPFGIPDSIKEEMEEEERLVKALNYKDLALTANNKEVADFISNNDHQKLRLKGDKDVTLYMFLDM